MKNIVSSQDILWFFFFPLFFVLVVFSHTLMNTHAEKYTVRLLQVMKNCPHIVIYHKLTRTNNNSFLMLSTRIIIDK